MALKDWMTFDNLGAFATGMIERDRQLTKEDFTIRADELKAKRDSLIRRKDKKYDMEIEMYKKERVKADEIASLNAAYVGKKVDPFEYSWNYLSLTDKNWAGYDKTERNRIAHKKAATLGEGHQGAFTYQMHTKDPDKLSALQTKEEDVILSKYADQLKAAKGDSFLIKKVLGRDTDTISTQDLETVVKAEVSTGEFITKLDGSEAKADTTTLDFTKLGALQVDKPEKWVTSATTALDKQFNNKSMGKENLNGAMGIIKMNVTDSKQGDFFTFDRDGNITYVKKPVENYLTDFNSMRVDYVSSLDEDYLFGKHPNRTQIAKTVGNNPITEVMNKHTGNYGTLWGEGRVLGDDGKISNFFTDTTNLVTLPANSVISIRDNNIVGTDLVIPNEVQSINKEQYEKFTGGAVPKAITNQEGGANINVRNYVGKVYAEWLHNEGKIRNAQNGLGLEENMNIIQKTLMSDKDGSENLTKGVQKHLANSLGFDWKDATIEEVKTEVEEDKDKTTVIEETKEEVKVEDKEPIVEKEYTDVQVGEGIDDKKGGTIPTITYKDMIKNVQVTAPLTPENIKILSAKGAEFQEVINKIMASGTEGITEYENVYSAYGPGEAVTREAEIQKKIKALKKKDQYDTLLAPKEAKESKEILKEYRKQIRRNKKLNLPN